MPKRKVGRTFPGIDQVCQPRIFRQIDCLVNLLTLPITSNEKLRINGCKIIKSALSY